MLAWRSERRRLGHVSVKQGLFLPVMGYLGEGPELGFHHPVMVSQCALRGGNDDCGGDSGCGEGEVDGLAGYGVQGYGGVGEERGEG